MARPKSIPDKEIIQAAYELIIEFGPRGLTFEKLSQKVGLVPAALVRRFTTKHRLLLETDRYALEQSNKSLAAAMDAHDSPIDAILAGFIKELSFASTIERFIHGQEYLLMDLADKDLYGNYHVSFHKRHRQVAELLRKAQARGEISEHVDPEEVAQFLQMILHGAGHVWAMDQKGSIDEYIDKFIHLALKPYQLTTTDTTKIKEEL